MKNTLKIAVEKTTIIMVSTMWFTREIFCNLVKTIFVRKFNFADLMAIFMAAHFPLFSSMLVISLLVGVTISIAGEMYLGD